MDPVTLTALTVASAAVSAGTQVASASASQSAAKAQQAQAERQAQEEFAVSQRQAGEEMRKKQLAQSRLATIAGASGSGASDDTVMQVFGNIEQEGRYNTATALADGQRRSDNIRYQAALDRWSADAQARINKVGAIGTLLGGVAQAGGAYRKYGGRATGQTGYG